MHRWAPPLLLTACAAQPIAPARESAYFSCPTVSIEDAKTNLARAGAPITSDGETFVQTDFYRLPANPEATTNQVGASNYRVVRVSVTSADEGVEWIAFRKVLHRQKQIESISETDVEHPRSRWELNQIRKHVCGGEDFWR